MKIKGIVIKGIGGLYTVKTAEGEIECRARGLFRKDKTIVTVGDKVRVEDEFISKIYPRKNILARPPISNIDKLLIVTSFADPEPDAYYIDKSIAIAEHNDIEPIIIFNKIDLGDKTGILRIYENLPYKKYNICALPRENNAEQKDLELLKQEIKDSVCALSGFSGVGKSSLLNMLAGNETAEVGDISARLQRGKNTTRHVELFSLSGGMIADTPGFSSLSFEYFNIKDRSKLQYCFAEFFKYLDECRFSDCVHNKEKGCAVSKAVNDGAILQSRYDSYVKMYQEIGEYREWEHKDKE